MAYAWSNTNVAFFVMNVGNTYPSKTPYCYTVQDDFGDRDAKKLPRPAVLDLIYPILPVIDSFNSERQGSLMLEERFPTKDGFRKLFFAFTGNSVVNQYHAMEYLQLRSCPENCMEMADMIANGLVERERRWESLPKGLKVDPEDALERIVGDNGEITQPLTARSNAKHGKTKGQPWQKTCFICKKYGKNRSMSSFRCIQCGTCLCNKDREREMTCVQEHLHGERELRCIPGKKQMVFPGHLKENQEE
jgi:hypothetical protein